MHSPFYYIKVGFKGVYVIYVLEVEIWIRSKSVQPRMTLKPALYYYVYTVANEWRHEKTNILHMRKQRRRSASR